MLTGAAAYDMIEELEQPFKTAPGESGDLPVSLRDRMDMAENILLTRYDYTKELSPLLKTPKSLGAYTLRFYLQQFVASMRQDLGWHLEPVGDKARQESAADRLEKFRAHTWLRLDPSGLLRDNMAWYMGGGFFWAAFLEMEDWSDPDQARGETDGEYADRLEREKRGFFPWRLMEHNPRSVSYLESQNELQMGAVRYRLPIIDLVRRFTDAGKRPRRDEPEIVLRLLDRDWAWLKAGAPGTSTSTRDLYRDEAEICLVDDGQKLTYYCDLGVASTSQRTWRDQGAGAAERYRELGEGEYDNPFGQVSLLLAQGTLHPNQPVAYRREGMLTPLILASHAGAILDSHNTEPGVGPAGDRRAPAARSRGQAGRDRPALARAGAGARLAGPADRHTRPVRAQAARALGRPRPGALGRQPAQHGADHGAARHHVRPRGGSASGVYADKLGAQPDR